MEMVEEVAAGDGDGDVEAMQRNFCFFELKNNISRIGYAAANFLYFICKTLSIVDLQNPSATAARAGPKPSQAKRSPRRTDSRFRRPSMKSLTTRTEYARQRLDVSRAV